MGRIVYFCRKYSSVFLIFFLTILAVSYSVLSIIRHTHFQSGGFDLGIFDQAVWRYAHLLPLYNTVKERIILGDHLTLTLPLFGIIFYIWDDVRILLIAQSFIITFSALPIYWIALKRLHSKTSACILAVIYSLFYGIQYGVYFDFHTIIIGVALLAWLAYAIEYRKSRLFWLFLILSLLTQENMGIAVSCLGFCFLFRKEFRKQAVFLICIGFPYSVIAAKISQALNPTGYQYWPEIPKSIYQIILRLFDTDEKRQVWLFSYGWYSFLPLFSPGSLIAVVTDVSQYFVTGNAFFQMWTPYKHHRAILDIFLCLGTIDILSYLQTKKVRIVYVCIFMLCVSVFSQYYFHFALNKLTKSDYWKTEKWMVNNNTLISLVPKGASVATQQNFVPHLSHRTEIYLAWPRRHDFPSKPCGETTCWWLDFGGKPRYLVVDTRPDQWITQILESNDNWLSAIKTMEIEGKIKLVRQIGDAKMFEIYYK